jgi:hypothetical protein
VINTETYVRIGPDTPITHKIETAVGEGYLIIGEATGSGTAVALVIDDPETFRRFTDEAMSTRDDYVEQVLEPRPPSARDDGTLTIVR